MDRKMIKMPWDNLYSLVTANGGEVMEGSNHRLFAIRTRKPTNWQVTTNVCSMCGKIKDCKVLYSTQSINSLFFNMQDAEIQEEGKQHLLSVSFPDGDLKIYKGDILIMEYLPWLGVIRYFFDPIKDEVLLMKIEQLCLLEDIIDLFDKFSGKEHEEELQQHDIVIQK
jgi:hypothetical protein